MNVKLVGSVKQKVFMYIIKVHFLLYTGMIVIISYQHSSHQVCSWSTVSRATLSSKLQTMLLCSWSGVRWSSPGLLPQPPSAALTRSVSGARPWTRSCPQHLLSRPIRPSRNVQLLFIYCSQLDI